MSAHRLKYIGLPGYLLFTLLFLILTNINGKGATRYTDNSILSQGNWVKVSVLETGVQYLSNDNLRSMGFKNPSNVKVFGYGGGKIPDNFDPQNYIDDLPPVPVYRTNYGIYFFARGPYTIEEDEWRHLVRKNNPYANFSYYYLTDRDDLADQEIYGITSESPIGTIVDKFTEVVQHELDLVSPGETGHLLVGEDMRYSPTRTYKFYLEEPTEGDAVLGASLFTNLVSGSSWTIQTGSIKKTIAAPSSSSLSSFHGNLTSGWTDVFNVDGTGNLSVSVTLSGISGNVRRANLDRITLNYPRKIKLSTKSPQIYFSVSSLSFAVEDANETTIVWDVTDLMSTRKIVGYSQQENIQIFTTNIDGPREYVAFDYSMRTNYPVPKFVEKVQCQNLHSLEGIDMVIFTPSQWQSAARSLANHRTRRDGLVVEVVVQDLVFNEFSSGSHDVNAFRRFLKMLRDKSFSNGSRRPRFVLLFGRSSYDNRRLTSSQSENGYELIPLWQTDESLNDNASYPSDDYIGFLDDFSGSNPANDTLSVSIGRLPVTSLSQANLLVNKIMEYETKSPSGLWRNRGVFIADDGDNGIHMSQTEDMIELIGSERNNPGLLVDKIYLDAYNVINNVAVDARDELYRKLDEGVVWLNYVGHANSTTLSAEGILNYSDVGSLYLDKIPFIYAATCDFMRWDANLISGAEKLASTKGGGVIGAISATRPVYIVQNGNLTRSFGKHLSYSCQNNNRLTIGEIYRRAKNDIKDENKLRYAFLGDPSMKLVLPSNNIVIERIGDVSFPPSDDDIPVLQAREDLTIEGYIQDGSDGAVLKTFNGKILSALYDADRSMTTLGRGDDGVRFSYDVHGHRLFMGSDNVNDGRFTIHVSMPSEVSDNYREATLNLYAEDSDEKVNASVIERRIFVYGTDEDAMPDSIPPVIDYLYLNHSTFRDGGTVNSSPMLIAGLSDNHAINMSLSGIGHWMSLSVDNGSMTFNDLSEYYEPESVQRGVLHYPLEDLSDGFHTLTLRVWDASGNSTSENLNFFVDSSLRPKVFDIYSDANPATETANFYLIHDRPDSEIRVTFTVYDMLGRPIWIDTATGRSDMFKSFPITWNLTDMGGKRVPRGIYLYRATISDFSGMTTSGETVTPTKKIAVGGR